MPPAKLFNLARVTSATVGTGTITLGAAVSGFLTFALAGVANGDIVSYGITDGANSEVGTGLYTAAGTTLTRNVTKSTNANALIAMSGTAHVFICIRAEDLGSVTPSSIATKTNVTSSATSVVLLAANTARLGATLYNDSSANCFVNFGATASVTAFVIILAPGSYYEMPFAYTGQIQGIWSAVNGAMRVTEFTA